MNKAIVGLAAIAAIGGGSYAAYKLLKKNGGPGPKNGDCVNIQGQLIKIDSVTPLRQSDDFSWIFDAVYRNKSCDNQSFSIIMRVDDKNGNVIAIQFRDMTLIPDQAAGFEWRFIFLEDERSIGQNKVTFLVWRSEEIPTPLSNKVKIIV